MKTALRTLTFRVLAAMPPSVGNYFYHTVQHFTDRLPIQARFSRAEESFYRMRDLWTSQAYTEVGKAVLEIGSGWYPIIPLLFARLGCARVVWTYDTSFHYSRRRIQAAVAELSKRHPGTHPLDSSGSLGLPSNVLYFPCTSIARLPIAPQQVDLIVSRFVLEHVHPEELSAMHRTARSLLNPNGLILHHVSPSDHRAYSDSGFSLWDFLQYSKEEWARRQTRFDYHNRLRLPEYKDIFRKAGFEVIRSDFTLPKPGTSGDAAFSRLRIHPDFSRFTRNELVASNLVFLLRPQ